MNTSDIERMAREAVGMRDDGRANWAFEFDRRSLARFAALVQAAERERAAKVCDGVAEDCAASGTGYLRQAGGASAAISCATLIRGMPR